MLSTRFAFAALGLACVVAVVGGAFVAARHEAAPVAQPVELGAALHAVDETETILTDKPSAKGTSNRQAEVAAPAQEIKRTSPRVQATSVPTAAGNPRVTSVTPPPLEHPAPSSSTAPQAEAAGTESSSSSASAARTEDVRSPENVRPAEPPKPQLHQIVISAASVLGLQLESNLSSERAKVEDRVDARVIRDVRVGSDVAIPAGSRAIGSVMTVEPGGKMKDQARLGIRFHTLVLADGTQVPIVSDTIYRDGKAPSNASAAKIGGGAVAGAILGAIMGGAKGAAIGGSAGAGAGTAAVMAGDRRPATFPTGTEVTARIVEPVTVTVEK